MALNKLMSGIWNIKNPRKKKLVETSEDLMKVFNFHAYYVSGETLILFGWSRLSKTSSLSFKKKPTQF